MAHHKQHEPNAPGHPSQPAPQTGQELDVYPAGAADTHGHHGHVIVAPSTLLGVFLALLFFTGLTVAAAEAETFVATTFNVVLPHWVNVFVALSIAAVKTTLVVMFFMQLKYDNPLNTMVFLFTMAMVLFFLGFTMTDMGARSTVDRYKAQYVVPGGTGGIALPGKERSLPSDTPITVYVRKEAENPESPKHQYLHHAHHAPAIPAQEDIAQAYPIAPGDYDGSSPEQSRPVKGLTLPGFAPASSAHDHGHTNQGQDEHH